MHLWIIPLLPLAGAAINGLLGKRFSKALVNTIALGSTGTAFAYALWVAAQFALLPPDQIPHIEHYATWLSAGPFSAEFGIYLDQLSLVMLLVVTGVGFIIHVYSVGYMEHEGGYYRYFAYLNIFMFFLLTKHFGTLQYDSLWKLVSQHPVESGAAGLMTAIGLLMLVGATGKSAQIPLYVWLPDAMEGPTPVSALIHAATMVTAGVYMVARSNPIFNRAPQALIAVAVIGTLTAIFAASIGMLQTDIKKVLAYSTISQ